MIPLPFLIPLPFALVMLCALVAPARAARRLGYLGSLAGAATLLLVFLSYAGGTGTQAATWTWFGAAGEQFPLTITLDALSLVLSGIVSLIGVAVFLYSVGYFGDEERPSDLSRYYAILSLFAASMLGVVLSGSLLQLFVCWELVGISSYLLIGFWHGKDEAMRAARKALLTILVGDAFLLAGIMLLRARYGTFDIARVLALARPDTLTLLAAIGIVVGAISKSAQFPLHAWLPDAMAGPTPVSAFLHSATMVKAGLFLVARMLPLLLLVGLSPWLAALALVTIALSACMALVETDIKRALAYSTMNQLGFVLLALSAGAVAAGTYHMLTHSMFKALLFFAAGIAIHATGTQDMARMRLALGANALAIVAGIGALALAGMVPLSGFFSKETILDALVRQGNWTIVACFMLAVLLSAAYIARWYLLVFARGGRDARAPWQMMAPAVGLALLSLAGGLAMGKVFGLFGEAAPPVLTPWTLLSLALVLAGFLCTYLSCVRGWAAWLPGTALASAARARFLLDDLSAGVARAALGVARACAWIDGNVVDRAVRGVAVRMGALARGARRMQTGRVATYAFAIVAGFIALVLLLGALR